MIIYPVKLTKEPSVKLIMKMKDKTVQSLCLMHSKEHSGASWQQNITFTMAISFCDGKKFNK
jgi:hypothetical protein